MDNTLELLYYSRRYDSSYYPQTEILKIWNNWYDEHKHRLEKFKRISSL